MTFRTSIGFWQLAKISWETAIDRRSVMGEKPSIPGLERSPEPAHIDDAIVGYMAGNDYIQVKETAPAGGWSARSLSKAA